MKNIIWQLGLVYSRNNASFAATKTRTMSKSYLMLLLFLLTGLQTTFAQDADFMRSMGKMYVVVAVIAAVFIGIVLFLIYLDRKLTKLENQIKDHDAA
jgi:CcmD family protein